MQKRILSSILMLLAVFYFLKAQQNKPNFLFIITDDQRWDILSHAGNPIIKTPNMDKLAREGVYFPNAFVTTPICAASRASILTGMYERSHEYTFDTPPLKEELIKKSYPAMFKNAGYNVGYIGKLGVKCENEIDTMIFDYYKRQDHAQFFYTLVNNWRDHRHITDLKGDQAIEYLDSVPEGQNFCLTLSFNAPHAEDFSVRQYIWPIELDSLYEDVEIPGPIMGDPKWFDAQPDYIKEGMNRIRWNWRYNTEEKYQRMVKGYYRMVNGIDVVMGRLFEELKKKKLDENTIIVFIGDNGYFLGERGFAGKWLMYEPSLRVPMMVYNPFDKKNMGKTIDKMVLNIDLAPTLLEMASIEVPDIMQGTSLLPLLKNENEKWRGDFFCEHLFDHPDIPQSEGIRTEEWKYFRYRAHPEHEELYNLKNDTLEATDLSANPEYKKILASLRKQCDDYIDELTPKKK